MDDATLRVEVENRISELIQQGEAFTTVDVSHPIIAKDESVRHRQVRQIIDEMDAQGTMDIADYLRSTITVYPQGNQSKPLNVRLWHPDGYDVSAYTRIQQKLARSSDQSTSTAAVAPRGIDMSDQDDDGGGDGDPLIATTSSGDTVTKQCQVQQKQDTLNIPLSIIREAGFRSGDAFEISKSSTAVSIEKSSTGKQRVDHEGRIRVHGDNVRILGKPHGVRCTVMVAENANGQKYIQVQ